MIHEHEPCSCIDQEEKFICPICTKEKEYAVMVEIHFPNPMNKKYPSIHSHDFGCRLFYCHLCVFKIFKKVYPGLHEDLIDMVKDDEKKLKLGIKSGAKCTCCEDKLSYNESDAEYDPETKDELK